MMWRSDLLIFGVILQLVSAQIGGAADYLDSRMDYSQRKAGAREVKNCSVACMRNRNITRDHRVKIIQQMILQGLNNSDGGATPVVLFKENNYTARADPDEDILEFYLEPTRSGVASFGSVAHGQASPQVTKAKLFVLIRWRKPSRKNKRSKRRNKRQRKSHKFKKRIALQIYKVNDAGVVDPAVPLAELRVMMHHTQWQELLIPTYVIQETFDSLDHRLRLRIVCLECETDDRTGPKPILFYQKKKTSKKNKPRANDGMMTRNRRQDPSIRANKVHKRGPFLQIRTRQLAPRRLRRDIETCSESEGFRSDNGLSTSTTACDSSPLYVSFADFGWDWIISPQGFTTNYCFGSCPAAAATNLHRHRVHQGEEFNTETTDSAASFPPKNCCRPVESEPLSLQYYTPSGSIKTSQVFNVIVKKCDCS